MAFFFFFGRLSTHFLFQSYFSLSKQNSQGYFQSSLAFPSPLLKIKVQEKVAFPRLLLKNASFPLVLFLFQSKQNNNTMWPYAAIPLPHLEIKKKLWYSLLDPTRHTLTKRFLPHPFHQSQQFNIIHRKLYSRSQRCHHPLLKERVLTPLSPSCPPPQTITSFSSNWQAFLQLIFTSHFGSVDDYG